MKLQKVTVAIAVVLGCGGVGSSAQAAKPKHNLGAGKAVGSSFGGNFSRLKTVAGEARGWKGPYKEIIDALASKNGGKAVVQACGTGSLAEEDKAEELKSHFETIFKYRDALNGCKDALHGKVKSFFDDYIAKMKLENKSDSSLDAIEKSFKSLQGMDSALRFHEEMKTFLKEKATALKSSKDDFLEADQKVIEALDGIYDLCVAKEFTPSKDAETTQKIDEFKNQVKKLGIKEEFACKLELNAPAAPAPEENASTGGDKPVADNAGTEGGKPQQPADPAAGTGAIGGAGPQQSNVLPFPLATGANVLPQGNAAGFEQDRLDDQLEQDRLERQQVLDELVRARQDASRPNRVGGSPDNSRSFQFPPVSVQPNPNQQQQNPNQQQQQYPPMQYPPYPMMPPVAPTPIPAELLNAARNSDTAARPSPAVAAQAAQTQSLMEMARLQQQLMQAQMANQQAMYNNPYNQNGLTSNINRLRRSRTAFRGTRGNAGTRFMSQGARTGRVTR